MTHFPRRTVRRVQRMANPVRRAGSSRRERRPRSRMRLPLRKSRLLPRPNKPSRHLSPVPNPAPNPVPRPLNRLRSNQSPLRRRGRSRALRAVPGRIRSPAVSCRQSRRGPNPAVRSRGLVRLGSATTRSVWVKARRNSAPAVSDPPKGRRESVPVVVLRARRTASHAASRQLHRRRVSSRAVASLAQATCPPGPTPE